MRTMFSSLLFLTSFFSLYLGHGFFASLKAALPYDGQMSLQEAVTPIMHGIHHFYNFVLTIMMVLVAAVGVVLLYIVVRFSKKNNPIPSKRSHHVWLEVVWTIVPFIIIIFIAVPSYKILHQQLVLPETDMTIKVTAHQWYWSYEYPEEGRGEKQPRGAQGANKASVKLSFDSNILKDTDLKNGQPRLLSVDNPVVVPIHKKVRLIVTSSDVVHSFSVPAFGVKIDAVPGRLNEAWFEVEKEGIYYGQCSQLCGTLHAFMPIEIHAVSQSKYEKWLEKAKKDNA